jgi:class 3 adenylate cyclase
VLFCDLVGSTEVAARLDPEDWRDVAARYQRTAAKAIERFGGHVAKYLGDGVLAIFGYPHAHDDDAERAVRAGLAITDGDAASAGPPRLSVRVGIHTGLPRDMLVMARGYGSPETLAAHACAREVGAHTAEPVQLG